MRIGSVLLLPALGALLFAPSCSGNAFTADVGAAAGEASGGEGAASGASGGASSSGAGADAGAAGAVASAECVMSSDCDVGHFCRDGSCLSCLDLEDVSELAYGAGEPFTVINGSVNQEGLRSPRRLADGIGLIYVRDFFGGVLWFSPNPDESAGAAITKTDVFENGGLPVVHALPEPLAAFNFFFARRARMAAAPVRTSLFGATLTSEGTVQGEHELPAPFNSDEVVSSHALALSKTRAIWNRNIDGVLRLQLVTSPIPPEGEATELRLPLPGGCGFASELDYAPWLSPDGRTLLFSARRVDEGCQPAIDAATHVFVLRLSSAGQPVGAARPLTGLAEPGLRQSDPSLSPDGCELLFSAQAETSMRLYHAPRIR